ncbi:unnamed protein product [Adineta steineri]|uniref:Uncharacterized protein n=1 Tax=Adineta steineri TaxID=433720 RepID=A0A818J4C7_9BILA|nr:unnamed protein product [Adineta steineri]
MNLFLIFLALILFHENYIFGLETEEIKGINVLKKLKNDLPDCDLHDFVKSENDYKSLNDDLKTHCTTSASNKQFRTLCHMLCYELTVACKVPAESRPSKAIYTTKVTASELCGTKRIDKTNEWIAKKVLNSEQKQIISSNGLCTKITSDENALPLARFFYKIAPRVREADLAKQNKDDTTSNTDKKTLAESVVGAVKDAKNAIADTAQAAKEKTQEALSSAKSKASDAVETVKAKAGEVVDAVKTKAGDAVDAAKSKTGETADAAKSKAGDAIDAAKSKTADAVDAVKTKAGETADAVKTKAGETADAVKTKAGETADAVKAKAGDAVKTVKGKTDDDDAVDDDDETVKTKASDAVETAKTKAGDAVDAVKTKTGKAAKTLKDEAGDDDDDAESVKTKVGDAAETIKSKASDAVETVKAKAGDVIDAAKTKAGDAVKTIKGKTDDDDADADAADDDETAKAKTGTAVDTAKAKVGDAVETAKTKAGDAVKTAKGKTDDDDADADADADNDDETAQSKTGDTVKTGKSKTSDDNDDDDAADTDKDKAEGTSGNTKDKVSAGQDSLSKKTNQTGNATKDGIDKVKQAGELVGNTTKQVANSTVDKAQKVLDVGGNKPDPTVKKGPTNDDGDDDDDTNKNANQSKDTEQSKQIPKPDLASKKDETKGGNSTSGAVINNTNTVGVSAVNRTFDLTNRTNVNLNTTNNKESGNDSLSLTKLIEKFHLSPSQLIELIKNSPLNPFGPSKDSSLNDSVSATPLINFKNTANMSWMLNTAARPSSSSFSLAKNPTPIAISKNKENKTVDVPPSNIKPNKPNSDDNYDDDTANAKENEKQLKEQQIASDRKDFQSATDKKDKPEDDQRISHDDYDAANSPRPSVDSDNLPDNDEDAEYQADNKVPSGMNIKPAGDEKAPPKKIQQTVPDKQRVPQKSIPNRKYVPDDEGWSGNFITYFLLFTVFVVVGYLVLHNKNKVLGLLIEGCRRNRSSHGRRTGSNSGSTRYQRRRSNGSRTGSRPSTRGYEKLKNINDVINIDDTNPISDKEAIILKT